MAVDYVAALAYALPPQQSRSLGGKGQQFSLVTLTRLFLLTRAARCGSSIYHFKGV